VSVAEWLKDYSKIAEIKETYKANERTNNLMACFQISVDKLEKDSQKLYHALGIFPNTVIIPIRVIITLWKAMSQSPLDDTDYKRIIQHFIDSSLMDYNNQDKTEIRLHTLLHEYNRKKINGHYIEIQNNLLEAYGIPNRHNYTLPDTYAWRFYAYHLKEADRLTGLPSLITDFRWLQAKLNATKDTSTLIADCDLYLNDNPEDQTVGLIRSALSNAAHILDVNHSTLAHQLAGRLFHHKEIPDIRGFLETVQPPQGILYPVDNGYDALTPAGGMLLRILQRHENEVLGVIQLEDGRILSWDESHLCLWDDDGRLSNTATGEMRITDVGLVKIEADSLRVYDDDGTLKEQYPPVQMTEIILSEEKKIIIDKNILYLQKKNNSQEVIHGSSDYVKSLLELLNKRFLSWGSSSPHKILLWHTMVDNIANRQKHIISVKSLCLIDIEYIVSKDDANTKCLWRINDGTLIATDTADISNDEALECDEALEWAKSYGIFGTTIIRQDAIDEELGGVIFLRLGDNISIEIEESKLNLIDVYANREEGKEAPSEPIFYGDARFTALAFSGDIIVAGDSAGRVMFLRWMK